MTASRSRSARVSTAKQGPLLRWIAEALDLVDRRVADACLHMRAGDQAASEARVAELAPGLTRIVGDARAEFYREAFAEHLARLDESMHRTDLGPTPEGENAARDVRVLGRVAAEDLLRLAGEAQAGLRAVMATGERGEPGEALGALWADTHRRRLGNHVERELIDSHTALRHAVGRLLIKPEVTP
jgi:hypothetical protein